MVLLTHIVIALSSIVYTTYLYFRPSPGGIRAAYTLVGATLASGTYLVVSTHSPLLHSCLTGLLYLAVVSAGIFAARHKLAHARVSTDK